MLMKQAGFSLIELVVAVLFLSVGILAVGTMQMTSVRGNFNSNNLMQATYAAQDRLEFLKVLPFDSTSLQPGNYTEEAVQVSGITYNRGYGVTLNGSLKTITYRVAWNDGVDHGVTFSTIRCQ
jgi:type IV pilus assembly protein PilV